MTVTILHGDCLEQMRLMEAASVDSVVTDPPYLISFMGAKWDAADGIAGKPDVWREALRVLKPGGHMLAMGGTRTYHRMVCAIEDAGFEVRDTISWMYGSGFPKSMDVSKAIDRAAGAEREVVGRRADADKLSFKGKDAGWDRPWMHDAAALERCRSITAPATPEAQQWAGWGTALKPAMELICVARKPLSEKTVAANVLRHGTGGLNIDACRVGTGDDRTSGGNPSRADFSAGWGMASTERATGGRWPANVIHSGCPEVLAAFDQFGERKSGKPTAGTKPTTGNVYGAYAKRSTVGIGDTGTAARFFYSAKASRAERADSKHPTQKPVSLIRYLVKLVTPPGGIVLDMFAGSGTTGVACQREGFNCVLVEQAAGYVETIRKRLGADFQLEAAD